MPKQKNDALFVLVKSLTKAEKRHFKMAHPPTEKGKSALFMQLFDVLDKAKDYDEQKIIKQITELKKQQLSNLKVNLYNHILESLRWLSRQKDIHLQIRQSVDYSRVLYNKGLYQQSLKLLGKAKALATTHQEIELKVQIVEFEKLIEGRHITRSIENRAELLSEESQICLNQLTNLSHLSNLALSLYGMYLKTGHARNEKEATMIKTMFKNKLDNLKLQQVGLDGSNNSSTLSADTFYEKVYLYQAYSWYAYILQDFILYYRYSQKWVDLFDAFPKQKSSDPAVYLKAVNNLLTAHFFNRNYKKFGEAEQQLESFWAKHKRQFSQNTDTLAFVSTYTAKINKHFLNGTFTEGLALVPKFNRQLKKHELHIDQHRILVFYYKIACLYFGSGENKLAIQYLNKIINLKIGNLRADIQCFARILHLIAHYELKHYDLMEYLIPSVYRFLNKNKEISPVIAEMLKFLKKFNYLGIRGLRQAFIDLKERLEKVAENPYERRFFLYLDVISWLESKIDHRPVQEIIHEKFERKIPRI